MATLSWKTTLSGVLQECSTLLVTTLCPALAYRSASKNIEDPPAGCLESVAGGYCPCYGWTLRTRLRQKYDLDGSILKDTAAHLCCHCVALARVWRESEMRIETQNRPASQVSRTVSNAAQPPVQSIVPPVQRFVAHADGQIGFPSPLGEPSKERESTRVLHCLGVQAETSFIPNLQLIAEPSTRSVIPPTMIIQQAENSLRITAETQSVPLFNSSSLPAVGQTVASTSVRSDTPERHRLDTNQDTRR